MHGSAREKLVVSFDKIGTVLCRTLLSNWFIAAKARFKRRATAVSNSIDRIKFDSSTTFETGLRILRIEEVTEKKKKN